MKLAISTDMRSRSVYAVPPELNIQQDLPTLISRWSLATAMPPEVTVHVQDRVFYLHHLPLISKSYYLMKMLEDCQGTMEIWLPDTFPGGADVFAKIAAYCYCSRVVLEPSNVAVLRCAAEFLTMEKELESGRNLCEMTDLYLTQVVLQSWKDTLVVLRSCMSLLPAAEELLIVTRCIESLAFMACMDVFDPEGRKDTRANNQLLQNFSEIASAHSRDWWVKDLLTLPLQLFERIIASIRRQAMMEKFVSPVIVMYAKKWLLFRHGDMQDSEAIVLLEGILEMLPSETRPQEVPTKFLFGLLAESLRLGCSLEIRMKLQARIVSQLEYTTINDFLWPGQRLNGENSFRASFGVAASDEVETMMSIMSMFMAEESKAKQILSDSQDSPVLSYDLNKISVVANIWDEYVTQLAEDFCLSPSRFREFIEVIPAWARCTHDDLYRAVDRYCMAHPQLSEEEREQVCRSIDSQKLSEETCIQVVQNERMPLRLIVQAMFIQQVYTRSLVSSAAAAMNNNFNSMPLQSSNISAPFTSQEIKSSMASADHSQPLGGCQIQQQLSNESGLNNTAVSMKAEFEATSIRVQNLEEEIQKMRENLQEHMKPTRSRSLKLFCNPNQSMQQLMSSTRQSQSKANFIKRIIQRIQKHGCNGSSSTICNNPRPRTPFPKVSPRRSHHL